MSNPSHVAQQLSQFIQLEQQLRQADSLPALGFALVNHTGMLCPCDQVFLWQADAERITHAAHVTQVDAHTPLNQWLNQCCQYWSRQANAQQARILTTEQCPEALASQWSTYLPTNVLWLPLITTSPSDTTHPKLIGALLLVSQQAITLQAYPLLSRWQETAGHAFSALQAHQRSARRWQLPGLRRSRQRLFILILLVGFIGLFCWPVQQTVLAPAQIEAKNPSILRAPIRGVVADILVKPNSPVSEGQAVVQMDTREIESQLEASRQQYAIAAAEFRQAQQQALSDPRSKASLEVLRRRRDQAASEVRYLADTKTRMTIKAPQKGIAIVDHPNDWQGRAVSLGERIMQIAQADQQQLNIQLPVNDAIHLTSDTPVRFFLNSQPTTPLKAHLTQLAYRPQPTLEGTLAYPLKAEFDHAVIPDGDKALNAQSRQLGFKGTAKLYGEPTRLGFYLLRRPLSMLRVWLSF